MDDILISYVELGRAGESSGLRVRVDGQAELKYGEEDWRTVARLGPNQVRALEEQVRASTILEMAPEIPAPQGLFDSNSCLWQAGLDGRQVQVRVAGWSDSNPAALPLRHLSAEMYSLISAAQMGRAD
jgi:hypothetical protein